MRTMNCKNVTNFAFLRSTRFLVFVILALLNVETGCGSKMTAKEYFERAAKYVKAGDYDRAIADYTEAIRLNPDFAGAYYKRGGVYDEKGDWYRRRRCEL